MMKVFIACSGLGHIRRGYESFFRDCYNALSQEDEIGLFLFKGGGESNGREIRLWSLPRNYRAAKICAWPFGRSGYFSEQLTFFISLLFYIARKKPELIYVSDVVLANFLRLWKKFFKFSYRVLFNNNGPVSLNLLWRWDHIQQVSPEYLNVALAAGVPRRKQTLLPSAVGISKHLSLLALDEKIDFRKMMGLPTQRKILLSVGAINKSRKRMDYLIREVATLAKPRPYLLLLGARESESPDILRLGKDLLPGGFEARSVEKHEVDDFYRIADVFVLASIDEGFGLAYVEALAHGLPCLVHEYPTSRYVLGDFGIYGDLSKQGELGKMVASLTPLDFSEKEATARHAYVYERFSWEQLKPKYIEMFKRCAKGT